MIRQSDLYLKMTPDNAPARGSESAEMMRRNRAIELDSLVGGAVVQDLTAAKKIPVEITLALPSPAIAIVKDYLAARGAREIVDVIALQDLPADPPGDRLTYVWADLADLAAVDRCLLPGMFIAAPGFIPPVEFVTAAKTDGTLCAFTRTLAGFLSGSRYEALQRALALTARDSILELITHHATPASLPAAADASDIFAARMVSRDEVYRT